VEKENELRSTNQYFIAERTKKYLNLKKWSIKDKTVEENQNC
jgi:hypothetical protein